MLNQVKVQEVCEFFFPFNEIARAGKIKDLARHFASFQKECGAYRVQVGVNIGVEVNNEREGDGMNESPKQATFDFPPYNHFFLRLQLRVTRLPYPRK
jgi:hypothetical protein